MSRHIILAVGISFLLVVGRGNLFGEKSSMVKEKTVVYYAGPRSVVTYANLGNVYANEGEYDLAVTCYKKALEIDPKFSYSYFNLGNIYYKKGYSGTAISCYKKAISLNPRLRDAHRNLGIIYEDVRQFDKAIACYSAALSLDDNSAEEYHARLAGVAYKRGRWRLAVLLYRRTMSKNPSAETKNNLAYVYADHATNLEELNEAQKLVDEALQAEPRNANFLDTKGWMLYKFGRLPSANIYLTKASAISPDNEEIRRHLELVRSKLLVRENHTI
mgnify:CR=1 FL=1